MKTWKSCSMEDAIRFVQGKSIVQLDKDALPKAPALYCDLVMFHDGSAVACHSCWSGPLSEVTPDIDADPPEWWFYKPTKGNK